MQTKEAIVSLLQCEISMIYVTYIIHLFSGKQMGL